MKRLKTPVLATIILSASAAFASPTRDHLQCFKIKDPAARAAYTADLTTGNTSLPAVEAGCKISVPAKLLCVDVAKGNVSPAPPGSVAGDAAQSYLCYKAKCARLQASTDAADQFGNRTVQVSSSSLVCAPITSPSSCASDEGNCNGTCADLMTDTADCGACGNVCSPSLVCSAGVCGCTAGQTECGMSCADLTADPGNCGGCGNSCSSNNVTTPTCASGVCNGACDTGSADCNNDELNDGCETSIANDPDNCGSCGLVCSAFHDTPLCTGGVCQFDCDSGYGNCDNTLATNGCNVNLQSNPQNCGSCGHMCSSSHVIVPSCSGGVCGGSCTTGFADCDNDIGSDGCETNVASDPNNCGGCGIVCSPSSSGCGGGTCQ